MDSSSEKLAILGLIQAFIFQVQSTLSSSDITGSGSDLLIFLGSEMLFITLPFFGFYLIGLGLEKSEVLENNLLFRHYKEAYDLGVIAAMTIIVLVFTVYSAVKITILFPDFRYIHIIFFIVFGLGILNTAYLMNSSLKPYENLIFEKLGIDEN